MKMLAGGCTTGTEGTQGSLWGPACKANFHVKTRPSTSQSFPHISMQVKRTGVKSGRVRGEGT